MLNDPFELPKIKIGTTNDVKDIVESIIEDIEIDNVSVIRNILRYVYRFEVEYYIIQGILMAYKRKKIQK